MKNRSTERKRSAAMGGREGSSFRIRQADVAKIAHVSRATVSRILNNCTKGFSVTEEVRARVMDAIHQLGYKPDLAASALRRRTPKRFLAWFGWAYPEGFAEQFLQKLAPAVQESGFLLTPTYLPPYGSFYSGLPWWRIDAAILTDLQQGDPLVDSLEREHIPYVSVNCEGGKEGNSLRMDDAGGMRQICSHLLGLGHRRIAYVERKRSVMRPHASIDIRRRVFREELLTSGGIPVERSDGEPWCADDGEALVQEAVVKGGATALVFYSASAALFTYDAVLRAGLRVPADVSLVSCHDAYPLLHLGKSGITAVQMDIGQAVEESLRLLSGAFENPGKKGESLLLKETLAIRGSTAEPRRV
ncbi:MAG: LacI family DNA-binding transcriptional regulator [Kiritimatiellia bacterium]